MNAHLKHRFAAPDKALADFVYGFSALQNLSGINDGVIIPNGKVDLILSTTDKGQFRIGLMGLETGPKTINLEVNSFFAVNFNPLAVEYILQDSIADILNRGKELPADFWGFNADDLNDFEAFCEKASMKIRSLIPEAIDERKRKLFELIIESDGEIPVKVLSEKVFWSARQINQYFNQQLGLSLKAYCNILRFQASLSHIKEGRLFPELNYYDQSHFIKEIKKLSGASPKGLFKNENGRFLQFLITDKQ